MTAAASGSSRAALGASRDRLEVLVRQLGGEGSAALAGLAADLTQVTGLLRRERALRQAVADPGLAADQRAGLISGVLRGKVGDATLDLLAGVVRDRWSSAAELVRGIAVLAGEAQLAGAEADGALDRVEDELFRVARTVAGSPELALALSSPSMPTGRKQQLLTTLLHEQAHPATLALVQQALSTSGGRGIDRELDELVRQAGARRQRLVAVVRVAQPLTAEQSDRLAAALSTQAGHTVELQVVLDPTIVGGVVIDLDGEVIDGSVAHRLAAARTRLTHS